MSCSGPFAVVASIALVATLTACGGGDTGPGEAASLPHDTPTGKASDGGPDQPPPAIEQENPQRFIERWAAAEARMQHGGPATPYLRLSHTCSVCRHLARTVAGYYDAGGYLRGGSWQIDSIRPHGSVNGYPTYAVSAHVGPTTVRESSSSPVQHLPGRTVTYRIGLLAQGSSFTVVTRTLGP